ncbi:hypothetical protein H4R99_005341 [Coemansia sp. RSA 1722]|nr:hypothetical protein LPJ57_002549 [Coemansia sp. RSA 486]KAJ2595471.1 hypothetical protein H4R99_005341 [Coemansia sp. RSA 1722]KAJ2634351.1 hypothetical protein GGF40_004255 [Coemansia sp. RSA 1286]
MSGPAIYNLPPNHQYYYENPQASIPINSYSYPFYNQKYAEAGYNYNYYPEKTIYANPRDMGYAPVPNTMYTGYVAPGRYAYYDSRMASDSYVKLKDVPVQIECPRCGQYIQTKVKSKASTRTLAASAALATIYWPLALLPFVTQWLKKTVHLCPCCKHNLGKIVTVSSKRTYGN